MEAWITGIGIVSPYGGGREPFFAGLRAGHCALRPIERFDASPYRNTLGGEVAGFEETRRERVVDFVLAAAAEALEDADLIFRGQRVGIVLGTNFQVMSVAERFLGQRARGLGLAEDLEEYLGAAVLRHLRAHFPAAGPEALLSLSCASGTAALATALEWIRAGRCEIVLAGGFDELSESAVAGLSALRAISTDTIRPWDTERKGTIFAEGAGVFVVESAAHAEARRATAGSSNGSSSGASGGGSGAAGPGGGASVSGFTPYARIRGRGINNDAFHMTAPDKSGSGIQAVMRMALADAGVEPNAVQHLNLHGTGTKYNDMIETTAIRAVYGDHVGSMSFTANKSLFGHAMGAAGALEAAATCLTLREGTVAPVAGLREQDPELDLPLVTGAAARHEVALAMTNSYGLGGTNASLLLERL